MDCNVCKFNNLESEGEMDKILIVLKNILNLQLYYVSKIIPKKKKRWVYGSWFGEKFTDNSKWLYLYMLNNNLNDIEIVWITKNKKTIDEIEKLGGKVYLYNTINAIYYILTADVVFMTQSYLDLSSMYLIGGAFKVQLWHGVPLKKIGYDTYIKCKSVLKKINRFIIKKLNYNDAYIACSQENINKVESAFCTESSKIIKSGQPRNDIFFDMNSELKNRFINNICDELSYNIKEKKIITYMPTFRDKSSYNFDFNELEEKDKIKLNKILNQNNAIIIQKKHFVNSKKKHNVNLMNCERNIINIKDVDTQELLFCTDILITDYSSCYFDFLNLDRPIIHYAYDYKNYKEKDRGLYYDLSEAAGGSISYEIDELLNVLEENLMNDIGRVARKKAREKFMSFEKGESCNNIINYVINNVS